MLLFCEVQRQAGIVHSKFADAPLSTQFAMSLVSTRLELCEAVVLGCRSAVQTSSHIYEAIEDRIELGHLMVLTRSPGREYLKNLRVQLEIDLISARYRMLRLMKNRRFALTISNQKSLIPEKKHRQI